MFFHSEKQIKRSFCFTQFRRIAKQLTQSKDFSVDLNSNILIIKFIGSSYSLVITYTMNYEFLSINL